MTKIWLALSLALLAVAPGSHAEVRWTVSAREEGGRRLVSATARNFGTVPAPLGRYKLSEEEVKLGSDAVALIMSGWQGGTSGVKRIRGASPLVSKTLVQLFDGARAWQAGFVTFDRVGTEHEIRWDDDRKAVIVASYCDFAGYTLAPGAQIETETLRIETGTDPYAGLDHWADAVAAHYRPPLWPHMPGGWVGWSWVDGFNVERYEDVVRRNARAIREKLAGFDIEFIWVSIGNLEDRKPGNWLRWNHKLFPSGPEALVRDLGSLDFKLGLWSGAYWLNSQSEDVEKFRDAILLRGGKPMTVPGGQWGESYVLDPTHPKTKEYLTRVFDTYRKWGVRYYMIDFLNAIGGAIPGTYVPDGFYDRSLIPGPQTFRQGLRTIRDAAGPDTYLLSSTGPTMQGVGLVNAARAGNDYGEGRPLDGPGKGFYPATFTINKPSHWTSHRAATNAWATHFFMHRRLFLADSGNVLTVDKPVPQPEAEISATIFGLNGGPVMLGDDIDRMDPSRLEMVKLVFPRLPEVARPVGLFEAPDPDYPKVFHLRVKRDWDEWDLVAAFNYGTEPLRQTIDFARLGLDAAQPYLVWDFWNTKSLGARQGSFAVFVPPQSVRLWRVSRQRRHPWLLSTDMHVRQGQAEIESCRWDDTAKVLTIRARRPAGNRGSVYVTVPKDMPLSDPKGLWIAKDADSGRLIVRCDFEFKDGQAVERQIRF
ncbi:MAG TPA: hypothetical protein VN442_08485 [Bryobacteraceae bacterium]|nr:hypothetical protein [Bryobacteraceae bacterium]